MSDNTQGGRQKLSGSLAIDIQRGTEHPADGTMSPPITGDGSGQALPPIDEAAPDQSKTMSSFRLLQAGLPRARDSWAMRRWKLRNLRHFLPGWVNVAFARLVARITGLPVTYGQLWVNIVRADGKVEDYGLVGLKVVTTAGVTKIVDFLRANDTTTGQNFKYHSLGTGSTAEAVGDTALVTELTTEYNPDSTRATGSQTNNGATVYRTVGSNTLDGTPGAALREHGIHSASSAGTLLDRTVFAAITLSSGDTFGSTYDLTCAAGG